jgi:hypothetical protein
VDARLASLAAKRREAEAQLRESNRELEQERARAERLQRELEQARTGATPDRPATPTTPASPAAPSFKFDKPKPILEQYTEEGGKYFKEGEKYDVAAQRWSDDTDTWRDEKYEAMLAHRDATRDAARAEQGQTEMFQRDIKAAYDVHPDWEDARDYVIANSHEGLQIAISHLPPFDDKHAAWTEVVQYFGDNPDKLGEINTLFASDAYAAIYQLGEIAGGLNPNTKKKPASADGPSNNGTATPTKGPREAPKVPVVVGAGGAPPPIDLNDDSLSMDVFAREVVKYLPARRQ